MLKKASMLLFSLLIACSVYGQISDTRFRHISNEQGLSNSTINCIMQDSRGFIWFGTRDGLNRHDGLKTIIYRNNPKNRNSLCDNFINCIFEDKHHHIWVGTSYGLCCFDPVSDSFTRFQLGNDSTTKITSIAEWDQQHLLIGTSGKGLFTLNEKSEKEVVAVPLKHRNNDTVNCIYTDKLNRTFIGTTNGAFLSNSGLTFSQVGFDGLKSNNVTSIAEDQQNNLWLGINDKGLLRYGLSDHQTELFSHNDNVETSLSGNLILQVYVDTHDNVWVGTVNKGLNFLNRANKTFTKYYPKPENYGSLSGTTVSAIFEDKQHDFWIGTHRGGVNLYTAEFDKFKLYRHGVDEKSLSYNDVKAFYEDENHKIWIGTDGGGLNLFDKQTNIFKHYKHIPGNLQSLSSDAIQTIAEDADHNIWIGTWGGGLNLMNRKAGTFKTFRANNIQKGGLSSDFLQKMYLDKAGNFWVATYYGGLELMDKKTHQFTRVTKDPDGKTTFTGNNVVSICEDNDNNVWFGTDDGGLNCYNLITRRFSHYFDKKQRKTDSRIIFTDSKGRVWVGMNGLYLFDKTHQTFNIFCDKAGLDHDFIKGITEGNRHNLWISTSNGLVKLNPITKVCRQFNTFDGLQGMEFEANAYLKAHDGEMYFGGEKGFNSFYPDDIKMNNFVPPVFITEMQIFNKTLLPGQKGSQLTNDISYTKTITLDYKQSSVSLAFTALNYIISRNNQYKYKLVGVDNEWVDAGIEKRASYTNLTPGTYTFQVKASNNDAVWNNAGAQMEIVITPPFWMTLWFRISIIGLTIGGIYIFYNYRLRSVKKQKTLLEQLVKERTDELEIANKELSEQAQDLHQLNAELFQQKQAEQAARQDAEKATKAKSTFLANMSHEIRTPLNGVIGMASLLEETDMSDDQKNYTGTIISSGEILLNLINDILDFSKIESGNMELENIEFDLNQAVRQVIELFQIKAAQQKIQLIYNIDQNVPAFITGDSVRLKQVLINLVSNALKFTAQGSVTLHVYVKQRIDLNRLELGFSVKDTGIGIPLDKISRLFKSFSQVDSSTTRKYGGTGLGLAICDKLVSLMGGKISVSSELQVGTEFSFHIMTTLVKQQQPIELLATDHKKEFDGPSDSQISILVAEDNSINQMMLEKMFGKLGYQPDMVNNGAEAVELMQNKAYDIIFMDIQMPVMDGVEATTIIRRMPLKQPKIIALTANAMAGDRENYLKAGMDGYLSKPMKIDDLKNLINEFSPSLSSLKL